MKLFSQIILGLSVLGVLLSSGAYAQEPQEAQANTPSRLQKQAKRISNGVASGSLTKGETKRLRNKAEEIRDVREGARADGVVNNEEREYLDSLKDKQSKRIHRQKHDDQGLREQALSRAQKQKNRIQNGIESGQLTTAEQERLQNKADEIHDVRAGALADGEVNEAERAYIQDLRDQQSDRIYQQKHDGQANEVMREPERINSSSSRVVDSHH
jgi:hypothetical protein